MDAAGAPLAPDAALLARYGGPGPRYTSYPTADRFSETFGPTELRHALALRAQGATGGSDAGLSVYVHVPFCESLCYYCACNKVITRDHERAAEYIEALATEISLVCSALGGPQRISQLHFGGGSPTFLADAELRRVMCLLQGAFCIAPDAEISVEVDPRTVTPARLADLREMGFNRLSFGVQDLDPIVQVAVHRAQSLESVRQLVDAARSLGFESINTDLIYGLPLQTRRSFARTVDQICDLRPDRVALHAYAHLPERFKSQRLIATEQLPAAPDKLAMLADAIAAFGRRGYEYVGMDHFALPNDELAIAQRQGRLHRNFQGYSTQPDCDLIGLGVSAISRVGSTYSQNAKTLPEYYGALREGRLPVARGVALTSDDLVRRSVIMDLMCRGRLAFEPIEQAHRIRVPHYFAAELQMLQPLAETGLVEIEPHAVQVTPAGWYVVRAVAMVFDRYLQSSRQRERYSRVV